MTEITFASSAVQHIYDNVLKRTKSTEGKELVGIMFQGAAESGDSALSKAEANDVTRALDKYDIDNVVYSNIEVARAWLDWQATREESLVSTRELDLSRSLLANTIDNDSSVVSVKCAFEALAVFKDEDTVDLLIDYVIDSAFWKANLARSALVNYAAPEIVFHRLWEMLYDSDPFVRGEALNLLRYFANRPKFCDFYDDLCFELMSVADDPDENPLNRATAREAVAVMEQGTLPTMVRPTKYSNITFTTSFNRFPDQLWWIVNEVWLKAVDIQDSSETITVLSVGSSIGAEPISILIALRKSYETDPARWGDFDVSKRVRVVATDLNFDALQYVQRANYIYQEYDPMQMLFDPVRNKLRNELQGLDAETISEYFDCDSQVLQRCQLKDEYRSSLEVVPLDIVEGNEALNGQAYIVVYNMVHQYIDGDDQPLALDNLRRLSQRFVISNSSVFGRRNYSLPTMGSFFVWDKTWQSASHE